MLCSLRYVVTCTVLLVTCSVVRAAATDNDLNRQSAATLLSTQAISNQSSVTVSPGASQNQLPQSAESGLGQPVLIGEAGATREQPEETTEFQRHVLAATQKALPIFGRELFSKAPSTFAPVDRVPVSSDYIVGPGDELMLQGWGQLDINYRAVVDRNGQLFIPKVGNVNVAGVPYADLKGLLKTVIGRYYKNFDLNVSLGQLRSIPVFVVGYAKKPGSYTVSSLSTLVNALFATGGPAPTGSMRSIQLRRGGKTVVEFDLYDLLLRGDKSKDVSLAPGDVIYIPPATQQVAIVGGVNLPAIYETKADENLEKLIATAGGLTVTAAGQKVRVERVDDRKSLKVEEFGLDQPGLAHLIHAGDIVTVYALSPRFDNTITLRGFVAYPGRYPFKEGMTIRDLIPSLQTLVAPSYWDQRNVIESQNTQEEKMLDLGLDDKALQIKKQNKLRELIEKNRSDINWDYAVIERINPKDLSTQLIPFNLRAALLGDAGTENLVLQSGDMVTIFSQTDLQVPQSRRTKFVRLEGEFNQAGIYQIQAGETLRQLLQRVGGVTPQAYWFGAMFTRESVRQMQQEKLNDLVDTFEKNVQIQASEAQANSLGKPEDVARINAETKANKQLVEKMRQVKAKGRIVLELQPQAHSIDELPDISLEDGDRLIIPPRSSIVNVLGAVYNESAYIYRADKTVSDYLAQAGGPSREADPKSIYVMRADGSVLSNQQKGWFRSIKSTPLMPGETIIVPVEMDRSNFMRSLKDWTEILYQFGLGASALAAIKGL